MNDGMRSQDEEEKTERQERQAGRHNEAEQSRQTSRRTGEIKVGMRYKQTQSSKQGKARATRITQNGPCQLQRRAAHTSLGFPAWLAAESSRSDAATRRVGGK